MDITYLTARAQFSMPGQQGRSNIVTNWSRDDTSAEGGEFPRTSHSNMRAVESSKQMTSSPFFLKLKGLFRRSAAAETAPTTNPQPPEHNVEASRHSQQLPRK